MRRHEQVELEVHTKVTVPTKTREDAHAIKLLNLKSSAHQLCTQVPHLVLQGCLAHKKHPPPWTLQ